MKALSENGNLLYNGIIQFDKKAHEVIKAFNEAFDIDLSSQNPFSKFQVKKNDIWKGSFGQWDYCFHGDSCEFINIDTRQFLEVKINDSNHFGAIDPYYLWNFFSTTEGLENEGVLFKDPKTRYDTVEELKMKEYLINVGDDIFKVFILNPEL